MQATFPILPQQHVTGLILAGGQAKRLGGQDKGLIQIANQSLVEHVMTRLKPQTAGILINANRNQPAYEQLGCPVIADGLPDFAGPLAGMLAGLQNMATEWLLTVPCDNPLLPDTFVKSMTDTANAQQCLLTLASCQGRLQPVYCLLHRSLQTSLSDFLAQGQHKVRDWIGQQAHCLAEFDDPQAFENINTPQQLAEAELNHAAN